MEEKESNRWLTSVREVEKQISSQQQVVVIGDRESDIYELFAMKRAENVQLLVRAKANRYLAGTKKRLFDKLAEAPLAGTKTIQVSKNAQRAIRDVVVEIRYTAITMASKFGKGAIKAWAVMAEEKNPPDGTQPVRWRLITTIPVTTYEKAQQILDWYAKRWLIERFHYTLKSGCKIEELQLQERSRLERALSLYDIVAWQLLWITYEAREHPDASVYEIVTPDEWNVLCAMNKTKEHLPTIHEGVLLIAKLGGFLARKGDKDPGVKKLWVGWRCLTDIMRGWYLAKEKVVEKKIVGKG
jgi:hypothetical protein